MYFMLDENVPQDVADMLIGQGHKAEFIRDYIVPGAPDQVVATASQELEAILVSFDGDFETISPRIPKGQRARFRKLSRIWMRCGEPQAALRLSRALDFVEGEFGLTTPTAPMRLTIGKSYLRTDR
jgi:predicted nuclease of predicted toxin-antitoxin system